MGSTGDQYVVNPRLSDAQTIFLAEFPKFRQMILGRRYVYEMLSTFRTGCSGSVSGLAGRKNMERVGISHSSGCTMGNSTPGSECVS